MTKWERDVRRIERRLRDAGIRFTLKDRGFLADLLGDLRGHLVKAEKDSATVFIISKGATP
jgi:hypothetical protein